MILNSKRFQKLYEKAKLVQQSKNLITDNTHEIEKIVEDYHIYQIELELQNEELQNTVVKLETEKERYINLYNLIPFGYFVLDENGYIVEVNELGASLLGFTKKKIIGQPLSRYIVPKYNHVYVDFLSQALTSQNRNEIEVELYRKHRSVCLVTLEMKRVETIADKKNCLLLFAKEAAEKKQSLRHLDKNRQTLALTEKNTLLNEFTETILHELNHPFAVITNYLSGSIRRLKEDNHKKDEVINALQKASHQFDRITEIIFRMKNLNLKNKVIAENTNINDLINDTLRILHLETTGTNINVLFYPLTVVNSFFVDKIHLQQIIINLTRNAIEAMRDHDTSNPKLVIEANLISEDKIEISLTDNGPGIANEHLHMLFSPYFTTKPYGIGLGLIIAKKLIEAHGGELNVLSDKNGTCFKFTLMSIKH